MEPHAGLDEAMQQQTLVERHFTDGITDPYDTVEWERRDAKAGNFFQPNVEVPAAWTDNSIGVVAKLYFATVDGVKEDSVRQMVHRVAHKITCEGVLQGHFVRPDGGELFDLDPEHPARIFYDELVYICLHQIAGFNTPTWLNIGVPGRRQCGHACQPWHAPVDTTDGPVPIGRIVEEQMVGTSVYSRGGLTEIKAAWSNGVKDVLRFKTSGGHLLDVTPDHLVWKLTDNRRAGEWVEAGSLAVGDRLLWVRPSVEGAYINSQPAINEAALAAWLATDGYVGVSRAGNSYRMEAVTVNADERDWVRSSLATIFPGHAIVEEREETSDDTDFYRHRICGPDLGDFIDRWSLLKRKADKIVPPEMLTAPVGDIVSYLASVLQADGSVDNRRVRVVSVSEAFLRGIASLLRRLGIYSTLHQSSEKRKGRLRGWVLSVGRLEDLVLLRQQVGFIGTRKATKLDALIAQKAWIRRPDLRLEIKEIEPLGSMEVYDIQTEAEEYTSGGILIHNCYPLSVRDTMVGERSITDWWRQEAIIFKAGGGSGINVSAIRGSMEPLSTGGVASGPLPYMRASNAGAETLKSGGAHRRAAKFVCINDDHPDVLDFILCKVREDQHMQALAAGGINMDPSTPEGERNIAETTSFQSANNSVCITDAFMEAAERGDSWELKARVSGEVIKTVNARDMLHTIAEAAWKCADPGIIFIDTINRMHTTPNLNGIDSPVTTVNTCGEITQNDDTACNLAALNVLKFVQFHGGPDGDQMVFAVEHFRHTVDVMATAMDIVCGFSELPTELITQNTRDLRQLGMGFTNLGAAIMAQGMPYDSDEGRDFAASITALLTGRVYHHSARMAEKLGAFKHFEDNRDAMMGVIEKHVRSLPSPLPRERVQGVLSIWHHADADWVSAARGGAVAGYRNALATAMMPTGTVSFLLGADTTGVEPALSLVTEKKLAAAGTMTLVNQSAQLGARALGGYSEDNIKAMAKGDFSMVVEEDLPTFATAMGSNSVAPMGHVRMVAAIQPFTSQALSKTVNLPETATIEDMIEVYTEAYRMGVKTLSVYRDNSKMTQVLKAVETINKTFKAAGLDTPPEQLAAEARVLADGPDAADERGQGSTKPPEPVRRRLPRTRKSLNHKIVVRSADGIIREGYVLAGMYPDGTLGEIFLEGFGKQGGFVQNALSAWVTDASIGFQYGQPLEAWCRKHAYMSDETGGVVEFDPEDPPFLSRCYSIVDYVARWIAGTFGDTDLQEELGVMTNAVKARKTALLDGGRAIVDPELVVGVDWGRTDPVTAVATLDAQGQLSGATVLVQSPPIIQSLASFVATNGNGNGSDRGGREVISGPPCTQCGAMMYRTGSCWQCACGSSSGGCG